MLKQRRARRSLTGKKPIKDESVPMEVEEEDAHQPTDVSRGQAFHIVVIGCVISNLSSMSNVIDYR